MHHQRNILFISVTSVKSVSIRRSSFWFQCSEIKRETNLLSPINLWAYSLITDVLTQRRSWQMYCFWCTFGSKHSVKIITLFKQSQHHKKQHNTKSHQQIYLIKSFKSTIIYNVMSNKHLCYTCYTVTPHQNLCHPLLKGGLYKWGSS